MAKFPALVQYCSGQEKSNKSVVSAKAFRRKRCSERVAAKALRQKSCGKRVAAQALPQMRFGESVAANALRGKRCGKSRVSDPGGSKFVLPDWIRILIRNLDPVSEIEL